MLASCSGMKSQEMFGICFTFKTSNFVYLTFYLSYYQYDLLRPNICMSMINILACFRKLVGLSNI